MWPARRKTATAFCDLTQQRGLCINDQPLAAPVGRSRESRGAQLLDRPKQDCCIEFRFPASIECGRLRCVAILSTSASDLETERSSTDSVSYLTQCQTPMANSNTMRQ